MNQISQRALLQLPTLLAVGFFGSNLAIRLDKGEPLGTRLIVLNLIASLAGGLASYWVIRKLVRHKSKGTGE